MKEYTKIPLEPGKVAAIAARLAEMAAKDRRLIDGSQETDPEFEVFDLKEVNLDLFDWGLHEARIVDFLVNSIRSFATDKAVANEQEFDALCPQPVITKRKKRPTWADLRHSALIAKMVYSKALRSERRRRRSTRKLKQVVYKFDNLRRDISMRFEKWHAEMVAEAEEVVGEWLPYIGDVSPSYIQDIVSDTLKKAREMKANSPFEREAAARLKDLEAQCRNQRVEDTRMYRKRTRKEWRWARRGSLEHLYLRLYRGWKARRMAWPLTRMRRCKEPCDRCKERMQSWERYRWESDLGGELTLQDAKDFHNDLVSFGLMDVLVEYLAILLIKEHTTENP